MKLAVVGTGYVGIVTSVVFAELGNQVWGMDFDKKRIKSLIKGKTPIYEPQLEEFLKRNLKKHRLHFTTDFQKALEKAQVIFICVGTPPKANGDYDLSYVFSAAKTIGRTLKNYAVVAVKSTVPPGTCEEIKKIIRNLTEAPFDVASCPEFLREGSAIKDSLSPSRVVIGVENQRTEKLLLRLHRPIKAPRVICDTTSAQLIKYAANAFLATKISFINAVAIVCDKIGADIKDVGKGLGLDPRIGKSFLEAGLGYGGSCFPKDVSALIAYAKRLNYNFKFLKEIERINEKQIDYFINQIEKLLDGSVKGRTLAVLGLSFKPQTDDLREARSIYLIGKLHKKGARIKAFDPVAIKAAKKIFKKVAFAKDPYGALKGAEALLLITEWPEFGKLDFIKVKKIMKRPVILDGRNFLSRKKLVKLGFIYKGIGR